jgi:hypothetical protein
VSCRGSTRSDITHTCLPRARSIPEMTAPLSSHTCTSATNGRTAATSATISTTSACTLAPLVATGKSHRQYTWITVKHISPRFPESQEYTAFKEVRCRKLVIEPEPNLKNSPRIMDSKMEAFAATPARFAFLSPRRLPILRQTVSLGPGHMKTRHH